MSQATDWRVAERLHKEFLTGLLLHLLMRHGEAAGTELIFRLFRRQRLEKFTAGLKTLGLDTLPAAIACGRFIYLANKVGGVKVEYAAESDSKAWVRYPPPRWIYEGPAICAVPRETSIAFMRAFHAHCGVSLANPNLDFVCTGITVDGDAGLTGYFIEEDRALGEDERLRFRPGERPPPFDPAGMPQVAWDEIRGAKARRNYAVQYARMALPVLIEILGEARAVAVGHRAAKLVGMQLQDEVRAILEVEGDAACFRACLGALLRGAGDTPVEDGDGILVPGLRVLDVGEPATDHARFRIWNGLVEGAAAMHGVVVAARPASSGEGYVWRIG